MSVEIAPLSASISNLISFASGGTISSKQMEMLEWCQKMSAEVWSGWASGELIAIWGLIPPSLLSNQAYLWMHSTEAVRDHTFMLVRYSQRVMDVMLDRYETINGHCLTSASDSRHWVRWLGGEFGEPQGNVIPFTIRRREHGPR